MPRFWTCHWRFSTWNPTVNSEGTHACSSGSNTFKQHGVSVGDVAYIVSISEGQLYLGGRMTVKKIISRAQAVKLWKTQNLYDADEWIVDPDEEGTLLDFHRRLAPNLTKRLRFESQAGARELYFVSETSLDRQATRGVRELTAESARLLDQILAATDARTRTGLLVTVTEDMIPHITEEASTIEVALEQEEPQGDLNSASSVNHEVFGTVEEYLAAFRAAQQEGIPDNHLKMLRAHYDSPNHTTTWAQLAKAVSYANGNAVNLHYGRLAARVAAALGIDEAPNNFWLYVLADWANERDAESGHTAFVLRRPVIEALIQLGVLPRLQTELLPDEIASETMFREGGRYQVLVNAYERSPEVRRLCLAAHGTTCCICGFNFGTAYGSEVEGYIHVHHLNPLSDTGEEHEVDPIADLRPVCPNCHAVIHLSNPCRSIEEVRKMMKSAKAK